MVCPKLEKGRAVCCYTMALNPTNNYILGAGCRDEWVRLYDRRTLSCNNSGKNAKPFSVLTQHKILHEKVCYSLQQPQAEQQQLSSNQHRNQHYNNNNSFEYFDPISNEIVTYFPSNVNVTILGYFVWLLCLF